MAFIPFLAYEASAGSGKTFNLVVRYLSLLFLGEDANRILSLTFTNKAANEMQERIMLTLGELETRGELDEIVRVTGLERSEILQRKAAVLEHYLSANIKVMTIDRFFALILRKFSLHVGLMPSFTTYDSQHELKIMARFLVEADVGGKEESLINLSLMASSRLASIFGLLDELYLKSKELAQMHFAPAPYRDFETELMHESAALKTLVDAHPGASKTAKGSMEVGSIDELLKKSWLHRESLDYRTYAKCYQPQMDMHLHTIQKLLLAYFRAREQQFFYELFSLLELYVKSKRAVAKEDGELGFDDVTALVYHLLRERIDSDFLYFRLDSRIEHMLLDEFQDTSTVQFEILSPLIEEMASGEGAKSKSSFFFVGDVKQSIYRFRGGKKELFGAVAERFGVEVQNLDTNYRSSRHVVEFVNRVFAGKIARYTPQKVRPGASEGYVQVELCDDQLPRCVELVRTLINEGAEINDIALLCATNGDGQLIEGALKAAKIEVVTETTAKLIAQPKVRALIEYLKYCYFGEAIYRRNFFALIAQPPQPLERIRPEAIDMTRQIKVIIERFGLGGEDLNILRFLQMLGNYSDIDQFVFEYERSDIQAARSDINGVRVLTVHKSKGLEYEHVIVLDRFKKAPPSRNTIIYEYDGVALQNLYLRQSGREALDEPYAEALAKEKKLAREDTLNALYVAFTRARERLYILQKSEHSQFEMLELPMQCFGVQAAIERAPQPPKRIVPIAYTPLCYGGQEEILRAESVNERDFEAIEFGLALHYTLEMMEAFTGEALSAALLQTQNRYGGDIGEMALGSIRKRIGALLASEPFMQLVEGEPYKEQPLTYKGELRYLDLLVKQSGRWVVIDYKSSTSHADEHDKQVRFYKKAVAAITGEPVEGYICYLLEEGVRVVQI